jgi:hypothetical protein
MKRIHIGLLLLAALAAGGPGRRGTVPRAPVTAGSSPLQRAARAPLRLPVGLRLRGGAAGGDAGASDESSWERVPWLQRRQAGDGTTHAASRAAASNAQDADRVHNRNRKRQRPLRAEEDAELRGTAEVNPGAAGPHAGEWDNEEVAVPTESSEVPATLPACDDPVSSSTDAEVRLHLDPAEDPGNVEIDFGEDDAPATGTNATTGRRNGPWPACKGDVGKLITSFNEKDYAAMNSSYDPPGGKLEDLITPLGGWRAQRYRALIIDVEGGLLETEPAMGAVLQSMCEFFGKEFVPEIQRAVLGASAHEALSILGARVGLSAQQLDDVRGDFHRALEELTPQVTDIPGALQLLQHARLHGRIFCCNCCHASGSTVGFFVANTLYSLLTTPLQ